MKRLLCLAALILLLSGCSKSYPAYYGPLGSAKSIDGTTVVVSVFADDDNTHWDFTNDDDMLVYSRCHKFLQMACEWIEDQVAVYGAEAEFIWDWSTEEDLFYTASLSGDLIQRSSVVYAPVAAYLDENVDSEAIMKNHNADNIIYMIYFNTDWEQPHGSFNYNSGSYVLEPNQYKYEMNICYHRGLGIETSPSSYAHEILHCFGAVDFHTPNEDYNVTEEYIQHLKSTRSQEIMYYTAATDYEGIPKLFTEIDAYFMGLIDTCEEVEKWDLGPSQFEINGWKDDEDDSKADADEEPADLSSYKAGDIFTYGEYKQQNSLFGSRKAPIEWVVLEQREDRLLAISRYALDAAVFNESADGLTWEDSSLRHWLNNDFYAAAFSEEEQQSILTDADDRVCILSAKELNYYLPTEAERSILSTEYAAKMSEYEWNGQKQSGENWWWLRTVTEDGYVKVVSPQGKIHNTHCNVKNVIRPIIWIETK